MTEKSGPILPQQRAPRAADLMQQVRFQLQAPIANRTNRRHQKLPHRRSDPTLENLALRDCGGNNHEQRGALTSGVPECDADATREPVPKGPTIPHHLSVAIETFRVKYRCPNAPLDLGSALRLQISRENMVSDRGIRTNFAPSNSTAPHERTPKRCDHRTRRPR